MALSWRLFRRDLKSNLVLMLALVLAVAALASVRLTGERLRAALDREAAALLGGDAALIADHAIPPRAEAAARQAGLSVAQFAQFPSMLIAGERTLLVTVRAADPGYPLRGALTLDQGGDVRHAPAPGTLWAEPRLLSQLGLKKGDKVQLGDADLRLAEVIRREPSAQFSFSSLAPQVLIARADLPKTGLIQPESRVQYRLLVAGPQQAVRAWRSQVPLVRGERIEDVREARPEVKGVLARAERFLTLASLLTAVLALATSWLASRRYVERHAEAWALMKTLGQSRRRLLGLHLAQLGWLGLMVAVLGGGLGLAAHTALIEVLRQVVNVDLPPPGWMPLVESTAFGVILLVVCAMPPLLTLARIPAWQVLRRQTPPLPGWRGALLAGALALFALGTWMTRDPVLTGIGLAALTALGLVATGLSWLMVRVLQRLSGRFSLAWRLGLANLWRQPSVTALQLGALALAGLTLFTLTVVARDLLSAWQTQLPPDTPNRFVINLLPEQLPQFEQAFRRAGLPVPDTFPMVRGRLVSINDKPVRPAAYKDERARNLAEREFNLSWRTDTPAGNRVAAGQAFRPDLRGGWSVEQGIAERLGIKLGDTLTYDIAGDRVVGKVVNLRALTWESFRVNFFVIGTPDLLQRHSGTRIASFRLPADRSAVGDELVRSMPNITLIDVAAALNEVQRLVGMLSGAVRFVLFFGLAGGVLVLAAAVQGSLMARYADAAVLKTLGLSRTRLHQSFAAEFLALGTLAGLLAASGAEAVGWLVARQWLEIDYAPHPWLWLAGPVAGMALWLLVLPLARRVANRSPMAVLREAG